jgi:hypothetical protein
MAFIPSAIGLSQSNNEMKHAPPPPRRFSARVAPSVERQIDENLKKLYQQALEEDLPEQLRDLVARLRDAGAPK